MELQNARQIIETLAQGIQPAAKPMRVLPPNAGKPWSADDDLQLREAFEQGAGVPQLAQVLGRSRWAVESRLVKLGQLTGRAEVPFAQAPSPAGTPRSGT